MLAVTMPLTIDAAAHWLAVDHDKLPWYAMRLLGMLAYGAVALSVIYGLLLSTGMLDAVAHRAVSFALHQDLAAFGLGLGMVHGTLLLLDRTVPYSTGQLLVPFAGPYRPLWVGIGQVAFYLMALVYGSYQVRRRIGQGRWRLLHYLTFLVFLGATAHGVMSGTDTSASWAYGTYVGCGIAVAFLFVHRVMTAITTRLVRGRARVQPHVSLKPSTREQSAE